MLSAALFVGFLYFFPGAITARKTWAAAVGALGGGIFGTVGGLLCSMAFALSSSTAKTGVLGRHDFEIREDGLFESTPANEQLNRWAGITAVERTAAFIYVGINAYLFHVIPRRSFASQSEYDAFFEALRSRWQGAKKQA